MSAPDPGMLTMRDAAEEVGRTPETIRRWVWSGRLPSSKQGNRLTVAREDLERVAGRRPAADLATWLEMVTSQRAGAVHTRTRSAGDLVLADRRGRASGDGRHAGR